MTLHEWVKRNGPNARQELARRCGKTDAYFRMLADPEVDAFPSRELTLLIWEHSLKTISIMEALYPDRPELWDKKGVSSG